MPLTTLIFGGSGKVARHLTRLLAADGNTVHSIIRHSSQVPEIERLGAHAIVQNIETASVDDLAATIRAVRADAVVWAAGAGGGDPARTTAVDQDGAIRTMDATAQAGVGKRYVIISAIDVRDRAARPEPEWYDDADRERSDKTWGAIGAYMLAKLNADRSLVTENARRGLEYTIVRPGGLSEDAGKGVVTAGQVHLAHTIPREDVAAFVVEVLKQDGTKGLAIDVVGGETKIADAVAQVVEAKVNTFAGRY